MTAKPLIEANAIGLRRGGRDILYDVDISVDASGFITIIGPNGAGKTMLLKCLMGIIEPDSGRITRTDGLRIGYVPQSMPFQPSFPIRVERFFRLARRASDEKIAQTAEETGIEGMLQLPMASLSSGELQRVLLARSLLDDPQLLVLDEPAQNLDFSGQLELYTLLDKVYAHRQVSVLMVSHDLHMVMASSRQVYCLYHHVCCVGEPRKVSQDPEFTALFGKDMAKMMAVYQHKHDHSHEHEHSGEHDHSGDGAD